MIEGFDVEGVIMSKLRVLCFFSECGWESKSIVSREIDSGDYFFFFLDISCESYEIKGSLSHRFKPRTCSRNTKIVSILFDLYYI